MMNEKRLLWSLVRVVVPALGFVVTCLGAYLVTLQTDYALMAIPIYVMIVFGFSAMLIGVFWNICHSMKSKMYQRRRREPSIHIFTVERPSCFPPSYEDSQRTQVSPDSLTECVVTVDGVDTVMSPAPPLYSRDSSAAPDCTWSWERPPRYSRVERPQPGRTEAEERREASSGL